MVTPATRTIAWMASAAILSACEVERAPAAAPHVLAGTWVRVYPRPGTPDTLILRTDGTVGGSTAGLDSIEFPLTRWKVGDVLMPSGFCIGEGEQANGKRLWACQGFHLSGDTLALANGRRTVFVRADASGKPVEDTAWTGPAGAIPAPRPGEGVKVVPPAGTR